MGPELSEQERQERWVKEALSAFDVLGGALREISERLSSLGLPAHGWTINDDEDVLNSLLSRGLVTGNAKCIWTNRAMVPIRLPRGLLWATAGIDLFDDGTMDIAAAWAGGRYLLQDMPWSNSMTVPAGSAQQENAVATMANDLLQHLEPSVAWFVDLIKAQ